MWIGNPGAPGQKGFAGAPGRPGFKGIPGESGKYWLARMFVRFVLFGESWCEKDEYSIM